MTQFGMYSQTTPRNDAGPASGQWNLDSAYRYISEAYGGYHLDKLHGVNVGAGIFMSYVGLYSYYHGSGWIVQAQPTKREPPLPESHPRQWVDSSSTTYEARAASSRIPPGSGWIVQAQPMKREQPLPESHPRQWVDSLSTTYEARAGSSRIPPTAVGG